MKRNDCMTPKDAEDIIRKDGWLLARTSGSHKHYKHPVKKGIVTIPFHARPKELNIGTMRRIFQQAGLPIQKK